MIVAVITLNQMVLSNEQLDEHILKRELIAISRSELNSNKVQGFPLAYSAKLLLIRHVYDFHVEGLWLVRRSDITDTYCRETDRFQRKLLEAENKLKRGIFRSNYSVDNFSTFLQGLGTNKIAILENESKQSGEFHIGRIVAVRQQSVTMQEFSGAGNWERQHTEIDLNDVTTCETDTNYINFYARHFNRTSQ